MPRQYKKLWVLVACVSISLCGYGCSSGNGGNQNGTITSFSSGRALDGSNAANSNGTFNVWTVNINGMSATPLTKLMSADAGSAQQEPSPNGTKFVFVSSRALDGSDAANTNDTNNIWVMNSDGSSPSALTKLTAANADTFVPVWSPDGTKIAFYSGRALDGSDATNTNNTTNIWVMNADGTAPTAVTKLTAAGAGCLIPEWSPDGSKIVFYSARALNGSDAVNTNNTTNIWVVNADGSSPTALTQLTANRASSAIPVWSPNGSKIAFFSSRALNGSDAAGPNGSLNIWVINADGSSPTALTKLTATNADSLIPVWSPDGSKIAFESSGALDGSDAVNTNTTQNIWSMNADGSGATPLTKLTAANASSFSEVLWFPDGSKMLYSSKRALDGSDNANANGNFNVWLMNADGSGATPLTMITAAGVNCFIQGFVAG